MDRRTPLLAFAGLLAVASTIPARAQGPALERVSTVVPFPRGLVALDGALYVLSRGRVRGAGGVTAEVQDQAGTIFRLDPRVASPLGDEDAPAVRTNGAPFAVPTAPPFRLWDRGASPPEADRVTDRPYCVLRYHAPTASFYLCAFSGIDKRAEPGRREFSKNTTDGILRYDTRTRAWYEVERHDIEAGGSYPHHDPAHGAPPHGWLNGPDNLLPVGRWLYAVAKDNSCLVRYDLAPIELDPTRAHPPSERILGERVPLEGGGELLLYGHSALAERDGWLYVGTRTSSLVVRLRLAPDGTLVTPVAAQLVARFEPFDPRTGATADLTDLGFDDLGRLYAVSAQPARVHRFVPDPARVYDGRAGASAPWLDLAAQTANPHMKIENLLAHDGFLYVCSGDGYSYQQGALGTVYRARLD